MSAVETVRDYYEALRRGEPLYPYFVEADDVVKVGVGERLVGYDAVAEGLREQTRTTTDWTVESEDLRVIERDAHATFADRVHMAWRDTDAKRSCEFDTRWSGTLELVDDEGGVSGAYDDREWKFAGMHVSVPWSEGERAASKTAAGEDGETR